MAATATGESRTEVANPLQERSDNTHGWPPDVGTAGNETKYGSMPSDAFNLALQPIDTSTLFLQHFDGRFVDSLQEEDFHLYYVRGQTIKPAAVMLFGLIVLNVVLYMISPDFLHVPECFISDVMRTIVMIIGLFMIIVMTISRCCWWRMESDLACDRMVYAMKCALLGIVVFVIQRTLYDDHLRVPRWQDGFDRYTGVVTPLFTFYNQPRLIPTAVLVACCWIGGLLVRIPRAPGWDNAFNFVALAIYLAMVYRIEAAAREQFKVHRQSYAQRELTATVREYVNKLLARRLTNAMLTALATGEPVAHHTEVGTAVAMTLKSSARVAPGIQNIIAVQKLHVLFGGIVDELAKKYGGTRVASQTGHSCFLVIFGLPVELHHTSERACAFASDLREAYEATVVPKTQTSHRLCIGVHSGALHGGVNPDQRMEYQAFGSVVDIATYMSMQPFPSRRGNKKGPSTTSRVVSQCFVSMATLETVDGCDMGYDPMPPMAYTGAVTGVVNVSIALLIYVRSKIVGRSILEVLQEDLPELDTRSRSNRSTLRKSTFRSRKRRLLRETFETTVRSQQEEEEHPQAAAKLSPTLATAALPEDFRTIKPEEDLEIIRERFSQASGCLWHRFEDMKVEHGYRQFAATNYITGARRSLWLCVASWCLLVVVALLISGIFTLASLVPVAMALILSVGTFFLIPKCAPKHARTGAMLDFLSLTVTGFLCWGGMNAAVGFGMIYETGGRTIVNLIQFLLIFGMKGSTGQIPWGLQAALSCILMLPEYYVMVFVYQGAAFALVLIVTASIAFLLALLARSSDRQLREVYIDSLMTTYALTEAKEEQINIFALFHRTMPAALVEPAMDWMAKGRQLGGLVFQVPHATVIFGEFTLRGATFHVKDETTAQRYVLGHCKTYHVLRNTLAAFPSLILVWASGNAFAVISLLPNSQPRDGAEKRTTDESLTAGFTPLPSAHLASPDGTSDADATLGDYGRSNSVPQQQQQLQQQQQQQQQNITSSFSSTPTAISPALGLTAMLVDPVFFSKVELFDSDATHAIEGDGDDEVADGDVAHAPLEINDASLTAATGPPSPSMSYSRASGTVASVVTTSRMGAIFRTPSIEVERFLFSLLQLVPQGSPSADSSTADAAAAAQWIVANCEWRVGVAQGSIVGGILSDGIDCDILSTALDAAKRISSDRRSGTDDSTTVYEHRDGYSLVPEGYTQGCVGRIALSTSLLATSSFTGRSQGTSA